MISANGMSLTSSCSTSLELELTTGGASTTIKSTNGTVNHGNAGIELPVVVLHESQAHHDATNRVGRPSSSRGGRYQYALGDNGRGGFGRTRYAENVEQSQWMWRRDERSETEREREGEGEGDGRSVG
jgi:hypothetical protein